MDYRNRYMLAVSKLNAPEKQHVDVMGFVLALHQTQLDMIDAAVEYSDMQQAKELLAYIQSL